MNFHIAKLFGFDLVTIYLKKFEFKYRSIDKLVDKLFIIIIIIKANCLHTLD